MAKKQDKEKEEVKQEFIIDETIVRGLTPLQCNALANTIEENYHKLKETWELVKITVEQKKYLEGLDYRIKNYRAYYEQHLLSHTKESLEKSL